MIGLERAEHTLEKYYTAEHVDLTVRIGTEIGGATPGSETWFAAMTPGRQSRERANAIR
jgi:hypothetical protein